VYHSVSATCAAAVLLCTAIGARADLPTAAPVDGPPFPGELGAVDAKWNLSFDLQGKSRRLPAADLLCWGTCAEPARGPIVVTADAALLAADVFAADKETISADSLCFGELRLPLKSLAGVVFDLPADHQQRDRLLDRVARAKGTSDRVVLHNGDEITGLLLGLEDDTVKLQTDAGPIDVGTERIAALILNPALRQETPRQDIRAWAGFADGSLLPAEQLVLGEKSLKLTTGGGQTWATSADQLVYLMPLGDRVTYLSDLQPAAYRHVPYLNLSWPYRRDRNVTGGRLRSGGRLSPKGLGMHSAARLTYLLDGQYKRFQAEVGIDDSTAGSGSVKVRVYVDGAKKYSSETIRGGMAPVPISVDISGTKRLDLIVDFADRADEQDRADWLNARLVR